MCKRDTSDPTTKTQVIMTSRGRSSNNKKKLDKFADKLIKNIKFEFEVKKNLGSSVLELHKKRLLELERCPK